MFSHVSQHLRANELKFLAAHGWVRVGSDRTNCVTQCDKDGDSDGTIYTYICITPQDFSSSRLPARLFTRRQNVSLTVFDNKKSYNQHFLFCYYYYYYHHHSVYSFFSSKHNVDVWEHVRVFMFFISNGQILLPW